MSLLATHSTTLAGKGGLASTMLTRHFRRLCTSQLLLEAGGTETLKYPKSVQIRKVDSMYVWGNALDVV